MDEVIALRRGITVEEGTMMVASEMRTGAILRGVDEQARPFMLLLTADDAELLRQIAVEYEREIAAEQVEEPATA